MNFRNIQGWGAVLGSGVLKTLSPGIAKGVLVEILVRQKISREVIEDWVIGNKSLWDALEPQYQTMLRDTTKRIGNVSWLTSEWLINAVRKDLPVIASLFLGDEQASAWLEREIERIRQELWG